MVVVIAKYIPDRVRGKLKLWFIEVAPYIFVSGVKDFCAERIANYIWNYCDMNSQLIIIRSISKPPYYKVTEKHFAHSKFLSICGIDLKIKQHQQK